MTNMFNSNLNLSVSHETQKIIVDVPKTSGPKPSLYQKIFKQGQAVVNKVLNNKNVSKNESSTPSASAKTFRLVYDSDFKLQSEIEDLKTTIHTLEQDIAAKEDELSKAKSPKEAIELKGVISEMKTARGLLSESLEESVNVSLKSHMQSLSSSFADLDSLLAETRNSVRTFQNKRIKLTDMAAEKALVEHDLKNLTHGSSREKMVESMNKIKDLDRRMTSLQKEMDVDLAKGMTLQKVYTQSLDQACANFAVISKEAGQLKSFTQKNELTDLKKDLLNYYQTGNQAKLISKESVFAKSLSQATIGGYKAEILNLDQLDIANINRVASAEGPDYQPAKLMALFGFDPTRKEAKAELKNIPAPPIGRLKGEHDIKQKRSDFLNELGFSESKVEGGAVALRANLQNPAGVWQKYSVGLHTTIVLRTFEKYTSRDMPDTPYMSKGEFRIFLVLHDIGKAQAVKEEGMRETPVRKEKELLYTQQILEEVGNRLDLTPEVVATYKALLEDVSIGQYMKGKIDKEAALKELEAAKPDFMTLEEFFKLAVIFHKTDAGAYKALRYNKNIFEVDSNNNSMEYSGASLKKMKALQEDILKKTLYK